MSSIFSLKNAVSVASYKCAFLVVFIRNQVTYGTTVNIYYPKPFSNLCLGGNRCFLTKCYSQYILQHSVYVCYFASYFLLRNADYIRMSRKIWYLTWVTIGNKCFYPVQNTVWEENGNSIVNQVLFYYSRRHIHHNVTFCWVCDEQC